MVSALTDRLFSGYSSSETNSTGRLSDGAKAGPTTDSGGYSADQEQSAQGTPPPFYIDLMSRHRKRHASGDLKDSSSTRDDLKRAQKEQEVNYLAHVARHEIARGGLKCPQINYKKPRLLSCPIDMSRVTLVHSKDFFTVPRKPVSSSLWNVTQTMMSPDLCMDTLQSIVQSCAELYKGEPISETSSTTEDSAGEKPSEMEADNSDVASTTSSVTEDGVEEATSGGDSAKVAISMGQALTLSKQPRYVPLQN